MQLGPVERREGIAGTHPIAFMGDYPVNPAWDLEAERRLGGLHRAGGGHPALRPPAPERQEGAERHDGEPGGDGNDALTIHGTGSTMRASHSRDSSPVKRASSTRAPISA